MCQGVFSALNSLYYCMALICLGFYGRLCFLAKLLSENKARFLYARKSLEKLKS